MNRRKFVIGAATGLTATASGALILAKGFAPPVPEKHQPEHLQPGMLNPAEDPWVYHELDPQTTADRAYQLYPEGNCMYALFGSVMIQFAELYGEPYSSFPIAMMKYGASGIGEYGTICGALNGAAALFGLFVREKSHLNALVEDLFTCTNSRHCLYIHRRTLNIQSNNPSPILCFAMHQPQTGSESPVIESTARNAPIAAAASPQMLHAKSLVC